MEAATICGAAWLSSDRESGCFNSDLLLWAPQLSLVEGNNCFSKDQLLWGFVGVGNCGDEPVIE